MTPEDLPWLERALELAERGRGSVSPNPLVGAVLTARRSDGRFELLGEGHHAELGGLHAERAVLADCRARGNDPRGACLYVTLEPCTHHARQPPCVEAILEAGIARVVIAAEDPSGKASGNGPRALERAGVDVAWAAGADRESQGGVKDGPGAELARRARLQNQAFRKHSLTGRPLVVLKTASSLDGRVATRSGESKWISSPESRALGHLWRAELDAIAVGSGTVRADDPELTARPDGAEWPRGRPLRVLFDSEAKLDLASRLIAGLDRAPLIVAVGPEADPDRSEALRKAGAELLPVAEGPGGVAIEPVLEALGQRGITSLLLEGGARLAGAFADAGQIDEVRLFAAPLLLGSGRPAVEGEGFDQLAGTPRGRVERVELVGGDALIVARMAEW